MECNWEFRHKTSHLQSIDFWQFHIPTTSYHTQKFIQIGSKKGLASKLYKEFLQLNNKTNNLLKWIKNSNKHFLF